LSLALRQRLLKLLIANDPVFGLGMAITQLTGHNLPTKGIPPSLRATSCFYWEISDA
jgi:hypothetical protein